MGAAMLMNLNCVAQLGSNNSQLKMHPSVRKSQKRSGNYSEKEDEALVVVWLNISQDAVQGNEQSKATYWQRVHAYFHEIKQCDSDRNVSFLTHRWGAIQESVNKFVGCCEQIENRKQSGMTSQDKIVQACTLYKDEDKNHKAFHAALLESVETQ